MNISEQMHQSFYTFDKNQNGMINIDELKKLIQDLDVKYIENIDVTIQQINVNYNGHINYESFLRKIHPRTVLWRIRRDTKDMNISETYQFEEDKLK